MSGTKFKKIYCCFGVPTGYFFLNLLLSPILVLGDRTLVIFIIDIIKRKVNREKDEDCAEFSFALFPSSFELVPKWLAKAVKKFLIWRNNGREIWSLILHCSLLFLLFRLHYSWIYSSTSSWIEEQVGQQTEEQRELISAVDTAEFFRNRRQYPWIEPGCCLMHKGPSVKAGIGQSFGWCIAMWTCSGRRAACTRQGFWQDKVRRWQRLPLMPSTPLERSLDRGIGWLVHPMGTWFCGFGHATSFWIVQELSVKLDSPGHAPATAYCNIRIQSYHLFQSL